MTPISTIVEDFFDTLSTKVPSVYNESDLQHELGYSLRTSLPEGWNVRFEQPVGSLFPGVKRLTKKEIDLVITDGTRHFAIELKCPRRGRHPETMFDVCKDLAFLEELVEIGFAGGLFAIHVEDPLFYSGAGDGIYAHFRSGKPLSDVVHKPTGKTASSLKLRGTYFVRWKECGLNARYWLQAISPHPAVFC